MRPSTDPLPAVSTTTPNVARMYDYYLGGKDNYAVDRERAEQMIATVPLVRETARANRAFLGRAVRFLADEAGIDQFLDIGAGLPTQNNVHQVAERVNPASRVMYVDNDSMVLTHARALLATNARTGVIQGDVRNPVHIVRHPEVRGLLDLSRPVAVMLVSLMHFIRDEDNPYDLVASLMAAVPSGSCLVLSHVEHQPEYEDAVAASYARASAPVVARPVEEIGRFFDGMDLVYPGLVNVRQWRPDEEVSPVDPDVPFFGAIGIKR
ncbi:SAM-dependent methyltransferase [Microtetraspora malaysiensis]|uniref:SAM-dependent methyltransferase n=1 Tax=Microtetraspora malaysiensis TaxID=161358 RepID=UPI003D935BD3